MKNGVYLFSFLLFTLFTTTITAQQEINWLSVEEVEEKLQEEPRKVLVKIYTQNCGWCQKMDEETFDKSFVADYINENFYAIALDANSDEEILFNGEVYRYNKTGKRGYHELAEALTKGNLSFPSVVFLDTDLTILQSVSGYKEYSLFQQIMTYYGKDYHKKVPWSSFQNNIAPNMLAPRKN